MNEQEFNLSYKIENGFIHRNDVKEFIEKLKRFVIENYDITYRPARDIIDEIDKLAGNKLNGKEGEK